MMAWFDVHPDRQISDPAKEKTMDWLIDACPPRKP